MDAKFIKGLVTMPEAKANGYVVDHHCYPHVAYKGPRANPTEWRYCFTEIEGELVEAAKEALRMYRAVQPAGGWQAVEDLLCAALAKAGAA